MVFNWSVVTDFEMLHARIPSTISKEAMLASTESGLGANWWAVAINARRRLQRIDLDAHGACGLVHTRLILFVFTLRGLRPNG